VDLVKNAPSVTVLGSTLRLFCWAVRFVESGMKKKEQKWSIPQPQDWWISLIKNLMTTACLFMDT
jgi:hypothetical protein